MIVGERVRMAREVRRLTQTELARRAGVAQSAIAHIESGRTQPSPALVTTIGDTLGFPALFFERGDPPVIPLGSLLFRARTSIAARDRQQSQRYCQILVEMVEDLLSDVELQAFRRIEPDGGPLDMACRTRSYLGISAGEPIEQLTWLLEAAGVIVLPLPVELPKRDAFSFWGGKNRSFPIIAVPEGGSPDRQRFSIGHEFAHLLLHPNGADIATMEREADTFAAEFLVPADKFGKEVEPPVTLEQLGSLKIRWGVSIQALIRRTHDLGLISERQYRYLFEQMSRLYGRRREPPAYDLPLERPRLLRSLIEMRFGSELTAQRVATSFALPTSLVEGLLAAHTQS